jgi:hypothetical protein
VSSKSAAQSLVKCASSYLRNLKNVTIVWIFGLIAISCAKNHRSTIVGNWSGEKVTIARGSESISIPIEKYGYLDLSLNGDSTYTMSLAVLKDVRVEKQIFGMTANKVLIPAVYKSTRYGKWSRADSGFMLSSQKGVIFVRPSIANEALNLNFTDAEGRTWQANLEPKE